MPRQARASRVSEARAAVAQPVWASRSLRNTLLLIGLAVLVWIVYANTLDGQFLFDDDLYIRQNAHIRLTHLSVDGLFKAAFQGHSPRPVAKLSFALNYYIHQYQVRGYHVVNILIHLTTGLLLWLFVRTTLTVPALRASYPAAECMAGCTALLWLVHPMHTESVTYISQRMNSMAAMFYLAALVLYARARLTPHRRTRWLLGAGCALTGLLALGTKEVTATLPVVLWLYEWFFFQDLRLHWLKRQGLIFAGGLVVFGVVLVWVYQGGDPLQYLLAMYQKRDFTMWERVLTEFRVVFLYLRLLLFPHPSQLTLDHDFVVSRSLLDPPTTLLALAGLVGLVGLACYLARKDRVLSFCLFWFMLHLVMESSVIGIELVYEYRTYLPSMLLSLLVVVLVARSVRPAWVRVALLGLVVLVWSVWTHDRNRVWANAETLWQDCVAKAPHKARPHNNLGTILVQQGKLAEALTHYAEAVRLQPTFAEAHYNLGTVLARQGKPAEAITHYTEALRLQPDFVAAHTSMGYALTQQGKLAEATAQHAEAVLLQPTDATARITLGTVLAQQGKLAEALTHFAEALRLQPASAEAHTNMGTVLAQQGKLTEAIAHYTEAVQLQPTNAVAHYNLGHLLAQQGQRAKAIAALEAALRYRPDWPQAANTLALLLVAQDRPSPREAAEAIRLAEKACQSTRYRDALMLNTLAMAYAAAGRTADAVQTANQALAQAKATGQEMLARQIQARLAGYERAGKP